MLWNSINFLKSPIFNQFKMEFQLSFQFSLFDLLKFKFY